MALPAIADHDVMFRFGVCIGHAQKQFLMIMLVIMSQVAVGLNTLLQINASLLVQGLSSCLFDYMLRTIILYRTDYFPSHRHKSAWIPFTFRDFHSV
jgi:hypothetical protein